MKRYGRFTALHGLTLEIPRGALFALVGPNGAGKTTALGLLTGLLTPTSGRVLVEGFDMEREPLQAKARLGFVPDRPFLWPKWTPREALRFVGAVFGMKGAALEEEIDRELSRQDLTANADVRNETLSHGTRQRVALATAFLHTPDLIVLDEPMVGLDPLAQRRLVARLEEHTKQGGTVLFTTHQLSLAEEVGTAAALLIKGRLRALGPPAAITTPEGFQGSLSEIFFRLADEP